MANERRLHGSLDPTCASEIAEVPDAEVRAARVRVPGTLVKLSVRPSAARVTVPLNKSWRAPSLYAMCVMDSHPVKPLSAIGMLVSSVAFCAGALTAKRKPSKGSFAVDEWSKQPASTGSVTKYNDLMCINAP